MSIKDGLIVLSYLVSSIAGGLVWWKLRGLSRQLEQIAQRVKGARRGR